MQRPAMTDPDVHGRACLEHIGAARARMSLGWDRISYVSSSGNTFSASAASLWRSCPRRWWFKYVDRLPEPPPGEPAVLGTFVHAILEGLLDEPPERRTPEVARQHARAAWSDIVTSGEWRALELDEAAALRFRQRAWRTIEAYFTVVEPDEVEPLGRELAVNVEIEGVPFRGFIDLVERDRESGSAVVTDYKTGAPPTTDKPWSADENREKLWQPLWYAAALDELGLHHPVLARLIYFNAAETRDGRGLHVRTGQLSAPVDADSLADARRELRTRWDETRSARADGGAEPRPGPLCGWCPFVEFCAEGTAEVVRRWETLDPFTGARRMKADAPAVATLGLTG